MSGVSIGHSHPRPYSGHRTLRRCRNNGEAENVILIDVDSENFENVIIIDVPESLAKKRQASSVLRRDKKLSFKNVIYIDDDDDVDDDEPCETSHSVGGNNVNFSAGPTSNGKTCYASKNFADATVEDNPTPVRLSKCKRTYSGKAATRNHYGLNTGSESDSSDDDYPDCELVEDTSGKVQELWEKAFFRRRKDTHNGRSSIRDHGSTSWVADGDNHQNVEMEDVGVHVEERGEHQPSSSSAFQGLSTEGLNHPTPAFKNMETSRGEACPPKFRSSVDEDRSYGKSSPLEDEATLCKSKNSFDGEVNPSRSFPSDDYRNFPEMAAGSVKEREHLESGQPHATGSATEMDNLMHERCTFKRSTLPDVQTDHSSIPSSSAVGSVSGKALLSKSFMGSGDNTGKGYPEENRQQVPEINIHHNEAKLQEDISVSNIQLDKDKDGQLHSQKEDTLPSAETSIINDREKLKETDEYKRALEEEWAARQQALHIQAEEAQHLRRLRKRRKAESMRLLDMERRQKERVEEMRNSQKKDEENMNLKEVSRAEVRKELKKLEVKCHNMASLLHLLGIRVGGWPYPSPQEVQTAYKRALLTFHPDRAPKSDIRKQVEAEEKFKLINRLKEKFSPSL